jgi:MarR family transcriptional regulator, lower aerobic nicotinate degradation pathway regulator
VPVTDDGFVMPPVPRKADLGLVDALAQLTFAVQGALGRIAAAHNLSVIQIRLLGILRDRRPTIKELSELLQLDKSSVTGLIDRAQERGLVRRIASMADRRSVQVTITAAGMDLADQGAAAFDAEVAVLVADLTAGQRTRLAASASLIVTADARRRGIDILSAGPPALS